MRYFNYNGEIYEEFNPIIGPDNRGLRYGDGLFETMRMIDGRIVFQDEHFARLWKGMKVLQFEPIGHFSEAGLRKQIVSLAKKNRHEKAARIRLNIIRGDGGLYDFKTLIPNYIIQTWEFTKDYDQWHSEGLVLGIYKSARKSCDIFSNLKHNNYLPYSLGALEAKKERWNDAIILNTDGKVCDTTTANVFIAKNGIIYTPPLSEGCVAGVMRQIIIKSLLASNWEVIEKELVIDCLLTADEVFLTNSLFIIRWVQRLGEITYQNSITRRIYDLITKTFS